MRLTLALGVLLVVAHLAVTTASAGSSDVVLDRRAQIEAQVLRALNDARAERGLPQLRAASGLRAAAAAHSRAMLAAGFFAHESLDGTAFHERIRRHYPARGWERWSVGETLLASGGASDPSSIVSAWLRSSGHREIVLSTSWREVGVGAYFRPDAPGDFGGIPTLVVTADFGFRVGRLDAARARS